MDFAKGLIDAVYKTSWDVVEPENNDVEPSATPKSTATNAKAPTSKMRARPAMTRKQTGVGESSRAEFDRDEFSRASSRPKLVNYKADKNKVLQERIDRADRRRKKSSHLSTLTHSVWPSLVMVAWKQTQLRSRTNWPIKCG